MNEEEKINEIQNQEASKDVINEKDSEKNKKGLTIGRLITCGVLITIGIIGLILTLVFIKSFYDVIAEETNGSGISEAIAEGCAKAFGGIFLILLVLICAIVTLIMGIISFNLSVYWVKTTKGVMHVITLIEFILSVVLIVGIMLIVGIFLISNRAKSALM